MSLRLLLVPLLVLPLACGRTEVAGFAQGDTSAASGGNLTGTSGSGTVGGSSGTSAGSTTGGSITSGTIGTSTGTTTGSGPECAPCNGPSDCASGLTCLGGQRGGICVGTCQSGGACSDASLQCLGGYCFPSDFCLGTGTSGTVGTSGTTGGCDLPTCFTDCFNLGLTCDPGSCTCQSGTSGTVGTSGTSGSCDLQTCFTACAAVNEICDPGSCTCQSGGSTGTVGTSGTSGSCDLQTCFTVCASANQLCDPTTCACQTGGTSGTIGSTGTSGSCDLPTCYQDCAAQNEFCDVSTCSCHGPTGQASATGSTGGPCDVVACGNYCFQQGELCDANTCGCQSPNTTGTTGSVGTSGTGTVSSSTGTSGFSGTSTATSTTGGSSGGGDCRQSGCAAGEACQQFGGFGAGYYACACAPAQNGQADTCAAVGQVCDTYSLQCRPGRDYEPCDPTRNAQVCAAGYFCYPSSNTSGTCIQACTAATDCKAAFTTCVGGACIIDLCGPGTSNGDYYQPCKLASAGDGFCQPIDSDGGVAGICVFSGSSQPGDPCPGLTSDRADQCAAGAICLPQQRALPDGGSDGRCYDVCNASNSPGGYTRDCSGFSTCFPDQRGIRASNPDPGICFP